MDPRVRTTVTQAIIHMDLMDMALDRANVKGIVCLEEVAKAKVQW